LLVPGQPEYYPSARGFSNDHLAVFPWCCQALTIQAEGHVRDGIAKVEQDRPNALEMPAIGHKAALQILR